jgi:serine/threonine protein kinase
MKPSNVMLSEDGLRLFDFGLGQADEGVLPGLPHLSRERFNAWTPGYAAPELLEGQPLSASADVYGVACVIYELASGNTRSAACPRPRPATSTWSASCKPRRTYRNTAGQRCEPR